VKTLLYVPRMFTRDELQQLLTKVPDDFILTQDEFWVYVSDRLRVVAGQIRWAYTDSGGYTAAAAARSGVVAVVAGLVASGVKVQVAVDPLLMAEAEAWRDLARASPSQVVQELYDESVREIGRHVVEVVDHTLEDGETGVLFLTPLLQISFPETMRVIRLLPFDPQDYLTRHRVLLTKSNST